MVFILLLLYLAFTAVVRGGSLDVFWDWFISGPEAPFHGSAPDISLIQALGLALVVTYLVFQFHDTDNNGRSAGEVIAYSFGQFIVLTGTLWVAAIIYRGIMV